MILVSNNMYSTIFESLLQSHHIVYSKEHLFAPPRRFRFDYCNHEQKVAWEIEGGIYTHGRHIRPSGFIKDCEKYNLAAQLGWRVFRIPTRWFKTDVDKIISCLNGLQESLNPHVCLAL